MTPNPVRVLSLLLSLCTLSFLHASPAAESPEAKARALLERMTLEEKVGQLVQYASPSLATGPEARANIEREVAAGRVGSLFNYLGAGTTRKIQEVAVKRSRLGIPLILGFDVIHGYRTVFPINLGQAASWDLAAIERAERIAATEAAASGIHWTFAPMVDIARDPRWGRMAEGSGEDVFLGSAIARARVKGFQGDDLSKPDTVLACVKHFAAYGASQAGRDYWTTEVPEIVLRDVYLPPFRAAIEAGAGSLMSAFNDLNGVPCSANPFLLNQILRHEWGFKGFVVSDWMSVLELTAHGFAADNKESTLRGFNAGVDMDMVGSLYTNHLAALVQEGKVSQERLEQAVLGILEAKFKLGLFDDPFRYCSEERERSSQLTPEHLEAARDLARKACVLLKNEGGALPLKRNARIAVVGPLADATKDLLGCWPGQGKEEDTQSILEALKPLFPGRVLHARGCGVRDDELSGIEEAVKAARQSDVVVAVLGESADMSGEAHNRSELGLPGKQQELLAALKQTGKPVVVVLLAGRALTLSAMLPLADGVLLAWHPGTRGAQAVADLLTGEFSPSGKLPVTFPRNVGQIPLYYGFKESGRPQDPTKPWQRFRSNYLDVATTPEFPFGFGLSYTRFSYSKVSLDEKTLDTNGTLTIRATLTNTGDCEGTEIAQLYVRDLVGNVTRPVRELKGFARISLKPGETREVSFTLKPSDLSFHHADLRFAPESGRFEVFLGGDSTAPKAGEFELKL